jgi:hypothetical protein
MMKPVLLGVTVYDPLAKPLKLYAPDEFVVVVAVAAPVNETVAAAAPDPLMVPLIVKPWAVELKFAVTFAPLTVTGWLDGVIMKPLFVGVTVYDPLASPVKL